MLPHQTQYSSQDDGAVTIATPEVKGAVQTAEEMQKDEEKLADQSDENKMDEVKGAVQTAEEMQKA